MKKRILIVASLDTHLTSFHIPYINWLKENDYEVHLAYKGPKDIPGVDKIWKIPFERSPFNIKNRVAFKKLKSVIDENNYTLIHCHTPNASLITRLAAIRARKIGTIVLYTSHGFHFYKAAPFKNWILFFPVEYLLSYLTDGIITVNNEDYNALSKYKFPVRNKHKINSIGVDNERLSLNSFPVKAEIKNGLGYKKDDVIVLYIAEFNLGKQHEFVINIIPELIEKDPNLKFLFAGGGALLEVMKQKVIEMKIHDHVKFLGFKPKIGKYIKVADIGISASNREGFGLGVAEILSCGTPVIITNIRGHNEIVEDGVNGFLFEVNDAKTFIHNIHKLANNEALRAEMGKHAKKSVKRFNISNTLKEMTEIYNEYL